MSTKKLNTILGISDAFFTDEETGEAPKFIDILETVVAQGETPITKISINTVQGKTTLTASFGKLNFIFENTVFNLTMTNGIYKTRSNIPSILLGIYPYTAQGYYIDLILFGNYFEIHNGFTAEQIDQYTYKIARRVYPDEYQFVFDISIDSLTFLSPTEQRWD